MSTNKNQRVPPRCPSRDELYEFTTGKLALLAAEAVAGHLDGCASCQAVLDELDRQSDPLVDELRDSVRNSPLTEAECARVVAHVNRLGAEISGEKNDEARSREMREPEDDAPKHASPGTSVRIRCPHCHTLLDSESESLAERMKCPHCAAEFALAGENFDGHLSTRRVAHFELLERLGEGSFGSVWKARDTLLDRFVAVKIPRHGLLESNQIEPFAREAKAAAKVRHPNIVNVYEVGRDGELVYIVSDFIDGTSLDKSLDGQPVSPREACDVCLCIARALQGAHDAGVVHRDLKPGNILVNREGTPFITDFGLAKSEAEKVTMTVEGRILGTPVYMPPEQARGKGGEADERSDVYSLGVILFEMLTGQPPFRGDVRMLVSQILFDEPPGPRKLNDRVPRDVETICLKCLEKEPGRRYQTAGALADDLQLYLQRKPIHARPATRVGRLWRWCRRRPALAALSVTLITVVAVATAALYSAYSKTSSSLRSAERNLYFHQIAAAHRTWLANDPVVADAELEACPSELRGFEWRYLKRLFHTRAFTLANAGASVDYSPDGALLATTGGTEPFVKIWDVQSGEQLASMSGHTSPLVGLDFSPDGRLVASIGSGDLRVCLWDVVKRRMIRVIGKHAAPGLGVEFNPDGTRIISFGKDRRVRVWETSTGKELIAIDLRPSRIRDVAVSPVGSRLAVALGRGEDAAVRIYDYETGRSTLEIPLDEDAQSVIADVAFSPDGSHLAVATSRGPIRIWQLSPLARSVVIPGPVSNAPAVSFDREGERLAAEMWDGSIRVWDVTTGSELTALRGNVPPALDICFSPDGKHLAAGGNDNTVHVWDASAEQGSVVLGKLPARPLHLAFSPSGDLVAGAFGDGTVVLWSTLSLQENLEIVGNGKAIWSVEFSPDGRRFATAGEDATVRIHDVADGKELQSFAEHKRPLRSVAFSPDGSRLGASGTGGQVVIWETETGKVETSFRAKQPVTALAFHPDGTRLAVGGRRQRVGVWDVASGKEIWQRDDRPFLRTWNLAWSPGGEWLAVSRGDGNVELRDAGDGKLRAIFGNPAHELPVGLAFSPDGQRLVTAAGRTAVALWEIPSGRAVLSLSRHPAIIDPVAFHPKGDSIATAEIDGTVRLWLTTPPIPHAISGGE